MVSSLERMKSHPALKRISRIAIAAAIVAQSGPSLFARNQFGIQIDARPAPIAMLTNRPVLGDFDGDGRLDLAELHSAGGRGCIRVRFGDSRESHLELDAAAELRGAVLARDANQDNAPDLIWASPSQSAPAEIWLSDGLGHFAKASNTDAGGRLRALLYGDSHPGLAGDVEDERAFLTPDPVSSEMARTANLDEDNWKPPLTSWRNDRREPELVLFYLRERGPPLHISLV